MVPQLIALLRQDDLPIPALAERIGKDPTVAAEVLRMAGSAFFVSQGPVQARPQAIQRLGVEGLQMAISRVVLRPMYLARPGSLTAEVAPRLWEHADVLSRHCADRARAAGLSSFDGYLAGLLHDTGWTVLCSTRCSARASHVRASSAAPPSPPSKPVPTSCSAVRPKPGPSRRPSLPSPADARRTPLERQPGPDGSLLKR